MEHMEHCLGREKPVGSVRKLLGADHRAFLMKRLGFSRAVKSRTEGQKLGRMRIVRIRPANRYHLVSFLYASLVGRSAASPRRRRLSSS